MLLCLYSLQRLSSQVIWNAKQGLYEKINRWRCMDNRILSRFKNKYGGNHANQRRRGIFPWTLTHTRCILRKIFYWPQNRFWWIRSWYDLQYWSVRYGKMEIVHGRWAKLRTASYKEINTGLKSFTGNGQENPMFIHCASILRSLTGRSSMQKKTVIGLIWHTCMQMIYLKSML